MTRNQDREPQVEAPVGPSGTPAAREEPDLGNLDPDVARWLRRYRPRGKYRAIWDSVLGRFITSAIVRLRPARRPRAESYLWALLGVCAWSLDQGLPLDLEVILDPDNVERYCTLGLTGPSQNTARSTLRKIGPLLTTQAPWQPPPPRIRHKTIAPPYTDAELEALRKDAARQSSPSRRRAARAILALGAGAGLDGRWVTKVRGTDVIRTAEAVLVQVPAPMPRLVPVLAAFEDEVLTLAEEAGDEPLVGGEARSKNKACRMIARYEAGPGRPRLSTNRARSTWLLAHLHLGTRLPELAQAAGFKNISSLDELLALVAPLDEREAARMLRGPG